MAIETNEAGTVITGEHVELYRAAVVANALALEITTTMRAGGRRSYMQAANGITSALDREGLNARLTGHTRYRVPRLSAGTKRGALIGLATYLMIVWGWEPLPTVVKAMGDDAEPTMRRARAIRDVVLTLSADEATEA